jgi:hypothetical protein
MDLFVKLYKNCGGICMKYWYRKTRKCILMLLASAWVLSLTSCCGNNKGKETKEKIVGRKNIPTTPAKKSPSVTPSNGSTPSTGTAPYKRSPSTTPSEKSAPSTSAAHGKEDSYLNSDTLGNIVMKFEY